MRRFPLPLAAAFFFCSTSPGAALAQGAPPSIPVLPVSAVPVVPAMAAAPSLSLRQAIDIALAANPELAAARTEIEAVEGVRLQAGTRPNPELAYLIEDTRRDTRTTTVQVQQPIELGGQRAARIDAAERALDAARFELDARRLAVRAAVATAFFDLLALQDRARVAEDSLALAQRSSRAAGRRVAAGQVSPVEETKARVAEAGVRIELTQVGAEIVAARARLAYAMGRPLGAARPEGRLDDLPALPPADAVRDRLDAAPGVRRAMLELERRRALAALERARRLSNVTVSVGTRRVEEAGRQQAVVGVSIPLPLFDRNQGNVLEAQRREDKAADELRAARALAEAEAEQALARLAAARDEARALASDVLPGAQSAFDAATKGFELGKFSFLEALDAQRTLLQARTQVLRALAEAQRAAFDLQRILGAGTLPGTP